MTPEAGCSANPVQPQLRRLRLSAAGSQSDSPGSGTRHSLLPRRRVRARRPRPSLGGRDVRTRIGAARRSSSRAGARLAGDRPAVLPAPTRARSRGRARSRRARGKPPWGGPARERPRPAYASRAHSVRSAITVRPARQDCPIPLRWAAIPLRYEDSRRRSACGDMNAHCSRPKARRARSQMLELPPHPAPLRRLDTQARSRSTTDSARTGTRPEVTDLIRRQVI
jgi:hypothetical protein